MWWRTGTLTILAVIMSVAHGAETPKPSGKSQAPVTRKVDPERLRKAQEAVADKVDLSRWETDKGLGELVTLPTGAGNAAEDYKQLSKLYAEDLGSAGRKIRPDAAGIAVIRTAVTKKNCTCVPTWLKPVEDNRTHSPNTVVFLRYMRAMVERSAELEREGDFARARELLSAIIVMGWHLTEDRPSVVTYSLGLTIQAHGCDELQKYYTRQVDMKKAKQCREYLRRLRILNQDVSFKAKHLLGYWSNFLSVEACARTATQDADPVWRQEAVLNLGVLQNGFPSEDLRSWTGNGAQQAAARAALTQVGASDKVPSIRKLAQWCLDNMTIDNIRNRRKAVSTDSK